MEKILIRSARIIDEASPYNGEVVNVLIDEGGKIASIGKEEPSADKVIKAAGMILSTGWFDMRASFGDPGFEYKEDIDSGSEAAASGGFTGVALLPNNKPVTQTKNDISYLRSKNVGALTEIFPIGAVSVDTKGEELTEMIDLHHAGAVAFSDGIQPIWHTDILLKSLQYLQKFDGLLINRPEDIRLNLFGVMHEGVNSTVLGMKGLPALSEELIVQRDIKLLEYAGGRLHFSNISSEEGLNLIRAGKKKGLQISCDIAAYQLSFDDSALKEFDTNYKVNPPFRERKDNDALIKGLQDKSIDVIVSSHLPQDEESKKLEFDLAEFGIISLQTVAHNIAELASDVDMDLLIKAITTTPRKLLHLPIPVIKEGEAANLTLFAPDMEWTFDKRNNRSRSKNTPFWQQVLKGKAVAVFNKGRAVFDEAL